MLLMCALIVLLLSVFVVVLVGVISLNMPVWVGVDSAVDADAGAAAAIVGATFVFLRKWLRNITRFLFKFAVALPTPAHVADAAAKALDTTAAAAAEDGGCGKVLQAEPGNRPALPNRPLPPLLPQPTMPAEAVDVVGEVAPPPPSAPPMLPPANPTPGPGRPTPSISSCASMVGKC